MWFPAQEFSLTANESTLQLEINSFDAFQNEKIVTGDLEKLESFDFEEKIYRKTKKNK